MEECPYTFDQSNKRLVTGCERDSRILPCAGAIFLGSLYVYSKRRFRIDQNFINLMGFTVGAAPASYVYANLCLFCSSRNIIKSKGSQNSRGTVSDTRGNDLENEIWRLYLRLLRSWERSAWRTSMSEILCLFYSSSNSIESTGSLYSRQWLTR